MAVPYTIQEIALAIGVIRNETVEGKNTSDRVADLLTGLLFRTGLKIVPVNKLLIFKVDPNSPNPDDLEIGDFVQGFVEGQFIQSNYIGGDITLLASFGIE